MSTTNLLLLLFLLFLIRIGFLLVQFNRLEQLWYDYERRGFLFQVARAIDGITWVVFGIAVAYSLWSISRWSISDVGMNIYTAFVAGFGFSLLERLPCHRFPRTNVRGSLSEAKIDLFVNVLMAVVTGVGTMGCFALYLWWRG